MGIALCIFGIRYKTISLTALCGLFVTQIICNFLKNLSGGVFFGIEIPNFIKESAFNLNKAMSENMIIYWGVILVISLVLSFILVSFIHTVTLVVILILIGISYTGGYHEKLFEQFQIENQTVKYILMAIVFLILVYLYFKIPKMILVLIFAISGSAMFTYGIDSLFNLGWESLDVFTSVAHGKLVLSSTAVFVWLCTFCFSLGVQFISVFKFKS
ncbi:hypothetical protein M153_17560002296 [Pseudoloma neurophilia]|uniref:Uncharacterized protein n=1 Tax=Pseudoloma neurophilia TaxID=146866 RepID=A0A0R0M0R4_9MICR|nr:hypothetical protein M153_17560002296 [Pseudoloma neurophilia]